MTFRSMTLLWLLALAPLAVVFLVSRESMRRRIARRFVSERVRGTANALRVLRPWLLGVALALSVVALAGPYSGYTLVPIVAREANRVVLIDASNSMAAADVGTSRLAAAKAIAMRLAEEHQGRMALIVFEALPQVVAPLTTDTEAVSALIDTIVPGEVGQPGSDIGSAILGAVRLLEAEGVQNADIVVLSDGEDQGVRVNEAIQRAKSRGIPVSAIVIGTAAGSTIPTGRGPLRDANEDIVTTYARADVMQRIASAGGGVFLENPFGARSLEALARGAGAPTTRETHARVPIDRYQWPLALAFVALLAGSLLNRGAE